jgi:hypothetical protein
MPKAQLLDILNLKSSSSQQGNFHGYEVPSEYTLKMTAVFHVLGNALGWGIPKIMGGLGASCIWPHILGMSTTHGLYPL